MIVRRANTLIIAFLVVYLFLFILTTISSISLPSSHTDCKSGGGFLLTFFFVVLSRNQEGDQPGVGFTDFCPFLMSALPPSSFSGGLVATTTAATADLMETKKQQHQQQQQIAQQQGQQGMITSSLFPYLTCVLVRGA